MQNKILILFIFLGFKTLVYSQNFHLGLKVGGGEYQLVDLKRFQNEIIEDYVLPVEAVQTFPNTPNYQFSFEYNINAVHYVGVNFEYCSTGGRNHLRDYSGEYALNMPLKGYGIGLQYKNILGSKGAFSLYGQIKVGYKYSKLGIVETVNVYGVDSTSSSLELITHGFYGEPNLGVLINIFDFLSIDAGLGYQINYGQGLHLKGEKDGKLYHVNWTGIRYYAGLVFVIPRSN